jgi:4-amino-4-deoxy-L-arabinose transferase-like glycosyltransferase
VRVAQAILSLFTLLLVYQLGKELYCPKVGLWAAAGYCFYPTLLGMNNLLLSEGLFTFFFVAAMVMAVRVVRKPNLLEAAGIGICLALGALTRSILWLFSPLFCILLFFAIQAPFSRRLILAGSVLATFLVAIFPWAWRNTQLHKTFIVVDVMGGRNVMMGNYEYTPLERSWATITDVTGDQSWDHVLRKSMPEHSTFTQGQIDKAAMKYGIKYFFAHPGESLQRSVVKFFNFWQLERTFVAGMASGLFGDIPKLVILGLAVVICGSYAAVIFLSIFGLCLRPPERRWPHALMLFSIAFTCLIHTAAFAHSRYHLPLIPILLVYAAAALVHWRELWARRATWQFAAASLCCVLLIAGWVREFVMVDLHHFQ